MEVVLRLQNFEKGKWTEVCKEETTNTNVTCYFLRTGKEEGHKIRISHHTFNRAEAFTNLRNLVGYQ